MVLLELFRASLLFKKKKFTNFCMEEFCFERESTFSSFYKTCLKKYYEKNYDII